MNTDYIIENGVSVDYKGKDSEVVIPTGARTIGKRAFAKKENSFCENCRAYYD